ncbi:mitochondrial complex succinate-ubiquinone oxidoreductase subunit C-like protein [Dinothrombium tinctorium]|uniref:Mitochondrial complex succinate-ubiquinone oxidoreductase subunit C-like protein n=1 Tax=Dinothrombium tinctorium TaxID=1965070 RepID=A0A3S3P1G0_9ACAR|nr:mitochondrial complex succinate-ubiquinone oxidoreductase subunit C-like protein [Dinothrombium tinctorium]RWS09996.1 mitochondrial complex succinate-ubiquinone oxidoreductase subunit C-like protein [Dinothrombium tinctorium]
MSLLRAIAGKARLSRCMLRPLPVSVNVLSSKHDLRESSTEESRKFFERNKQLNRPMSPISPIIINPPLTTVLSISHRLTGLSLSVLVYGWGISEIYARSNFAQQLDMLQATFPSSFLATIKFLVITSFAFHFLNGIRHLAWDMGYGFTLKELYLSGYVVLSITLIIAAYALSSY